MTCRNISSLLIITLLAGACAQTPMQRPDEDFDTSVSTPTYRKQGPLVLFDEAHNNFHTTAGRYAPFVQLITNDGYQVKPLTQEFSDENLKSAQVLVIANASGTNVTSNDPAFSDAECETIRSWVGNGGALLLIADHFPFGSAAKNLALKFGIHFQEGMVQDSVHYDKTAGEESQLVFTRENGLLADHEITNGINKVVTFTGQSIRCAEKAGFPFLLLSTAAYGMDAVTKLTRDGDDTRVEVNYENPQPAEGRSQGIALSYGKGRVVCLGEAAMLTAQKTSGNQAVGMNYNPDNKKLALNIMRWLAETR